MNAENTENTENVEQTNEDTIYDWHNEPEGVLKWALPTLLSTQRGLGGLDRMSELERRTQGWTNVELRVLVNDVELPARPLLEGLVHNLEHEVERLAARRLRQVAWLETLRLHVEALEAALVTRLRDAARELGLDLDLFEEDA